MVGLPRRPVRWLVVVVLVAASPLLAQTTCFEVAEERPLPPVLLHAQDVAWGDEGSLVLASPRTGVHEWPLAEGAEPRRVISGTLDPSGAEVWHPRMLAVEEGVVVTASPVFAVAWKTRGEDALSGQAAFAGPTAMDLDTGQLAVLGFDQDDQGRSAPDGAIAWIGSLGDDFEQREPILFSADGPGVQRMGRCAALYAGQLRYLADGTLAIVPGVEPGVYQVDRKGRLLRTWQSETLGIDADCQLSDAQFDRIRLSEVPRWQWINRHRVVDEILPLPAGPGFVVRRRDADATRWDLVRPAPDGTVERCRLPFESKTERTRLAADLQDGRLVFLLWSYAFPIGEDREQAEPPRLIFARWSPATPAK